MVDEKPANEHQKLNLGPNASLFLLCQRVIYEMAAGGFDFVAATARCLVRALQRSGCSSLQELVEMTGASVSAIETLKWEGLDSHGHVQQDCAVTAKNGESLLALRDRSVLARWGQKLQVAKDDAARAAAAAAADAAAAAKEVPVDQGPDVAALAQASGYGAWPKSLLPTRCMIAVLKKATQGDKGSPVPWADPKMDPWYDTRWPKGSADSGDVVDDDDHLLLLGNKVEEYGFAGAARDLMAQNAVAAALRAQRSSIRISQWTGAMARILHAMAVLGYLGPAGSSVASNYLSVLFELAAEKGAEFTMAYDRELRRHIRRESIKVEEAVKLLTVLDDARAAALQRSMDRDRSAKAAKTDKRGTPAPAGGKGGGKGNPGRDTRNHDRGQQRPPHGQNRGRPDHRGNRDHRDKRPRGQQDDVKVEDNAGGGGGRPVKRR